MTGYENDGRFPDDTPVLTPFPLTRGLLPDFDRDWWPWVPGTVVQQVGEDEWQVVIDGRGDLAEPDPDKPGEWLYPVCFRDSAELRVVTVEEWEKQLVRRHENDTKGEQG